MTLTSHINAVRQAIGDNGEEQRLIRTVARKGFRFVGDVREVQSSDGFGASRTGTLNSDEPPAHALALPDKPSIATLPFLNLSGDPEQEYFADGVVEDIISALSRIGWLFVISRNSSFTYKGRAVDVKQVGRELGVRYVLEGSVRKAAHRVRITGQLIDATTGAHLWAERFESAIDDIFELQDRWPRASSARSRRSWSGRKSIARSGSRPKAWTPTTTICAAWRTFTSAPGGYRRGAAVVPKAAELDPDFASAYGMAAWCYFWRKVDGWMTDHAGRPPRAPGWPAGRWSWA